eukprot:COSAG02_NODE_1477_length_12419_cov_15.891396_11_plen_83_part_00
MDRLRARTNNSRIYPFWNRSEGLSRGIYRAVGVIGGFTDRLAEKQNGKSSRNSYLYSCRSKEQLVVVVVEVLVLLLLFFLLP